MLYQKSKAKNIIADRQQIKKIVEEALDKMATVVASTYGPGGRPVLIERDGLAAIASKDGMTVAKSLGVANAEANLIIEAAKEICLNTAKQAGDGTTTAIILANSLVKHGLQFLQDNPKYNPQRMVNELKQLYEDVIVEFLKQHSKKVEKEEDLIDVATISANGDKKIAKAAVDAVMAAGEDGTVLVEESQDPTIKLETMDGFIVTSGLKDLGSIGPSFINDKSNQQTKMDNGIVFLYDGTINDLSVMAILQNAVEGNELYGKPIIIFAHGFADIVVDKCLKSTKGGYTIVPIKTPLGGYANSRTMFLHDMAAYTDAKVYDPATINDGIWSSEDECGFGSFISAKVNLYESVITSNAPASAIDARVSELKAIAEIAPSDHDRMHIKAAIGKLTGGVSTIWVGGNSELEAREKKHRVEDSVEAVRSAIAEGIVPGGCAVHLTLAKLISEHKDYKPSWKIMEEALKFPFFMLLSNCGEDVEEVWSMLSNNITSNKLPQLIFDANKHELVDPIKAGIIEPTKVCRVSIGNALSVASLLITLGGIVVSPRDANLETQLEMSKQAFRDMLHGEGIGQE
jgi:chaperonin GroEL